ncbi:MAG: hypothetical protein MZV64_13210 [Ignavibacteriales bacterium]|nr:hypothetical protein [Ignavibacteriales bacterium]
MAKPWLSSPAAATSASSIPGAGRRAASTSNPSTCPASSSKARGRRRTTPRSTASCRARGETVRRLHAGTPDAFRLSLTETLRPRPARPAADPGRGLRRQRRRRGGDPPGPLRPHPPRAGRDGRPETEDGQAGPRPGPGRHGPAPGRVQRQVRLRLQARLEGDRAGGLHPRRQGHRRGPRPARSGLPGRGAQARRPRRAEVAAQGQRQHRRRRDAARHAPEHGRDPGRRGPGRQEDARAGAGIGPRPEPGEDRGGRVKRRQLVALLVFASLLAVWILIEIGT